MVSEKLRGYTMPNHTIINTNFQTLEARLEPLTCTLCAGVIIDGNATIGPFNAEGELTFICMRHRQNFRQFINLFADFRTVERQKLSQKIITTKGATPDAWFLH